MGLPPGVTLVPMPQAPPPPPPAAPSGPPPGVSFVPMPQAPSTAPAATPAPADLVSNPNREGTYQVQGPGGTIGVPYSKIKSAAQAGYNFSNDDDANRYEKDAANDPVAQLGQLGRGFVKGGAETLRTAARLATRAGAVTGLSPAVPGDLNPNNPINKAADAPAEGVAGKAGYAIDNILEFAMGDEALKGLSLGEKMAKIAPLVRTLQKLPQPLLDALHVGIQTGAVSGAQAAAHGATAGESAEAAGLGAVGGAALHTTAALAGAAIDHISPTVENIGGTDVTRLASQQPHASTAQTLAATAEHSPIVQAAQQQAGQEIIANSAKSAAGQHLGELNEGRTAPTGPKALPASTSPYKFRIDTTPAEEAVEHGSQEGGPQTYAGTRETPNPDYRAPAAATADRAELGAASSAVPERSFTGEPTQTRSNFQQTPPPNDQGSVSRTGGGQIVTEDAATAKAHIGALNDAIDSPDFSSRTPEEQQQLLGQRADMQRQMSEYHAHQAQSQPSIYANRSTFAPIDVSKTVARVGSFGDAADALEDGAKQVYDRLDDLTGGRFSELRAENKSAWNAVANGGGDAAQARLADTQQQLDTMFSGKDPHVGDSVSQTDLALGNEAWKKAQVLRDVHSKIESSFDTSIGTSDRANAYRGFNGNRLRGALKQLTMKYGERPLGRVIGGDQLDNLTRLADITRTQADRAKFGAGVNHIAQWMTRNEGKVAGAVGAAGGYVGHFVGGVEGAGVGAAAAEAAYVAGRRVMRAIATDPRVGKNLTFAIQAGARPQNYAPLIGAMVREKDQEQGGQNQ